MVTLIRLLLLACVLAAYTPAQAQTGEVEDILIRNVTIIDPSGVAEDRLVNILIRKQKLEVITEDKISHEEAQQVVNANGGFIVGALKIGQSPNFMILRADPREDFEIMLDTKTHASFAVHDGHVVKNSLISVAQDESEDEPVKSGWLAYTPPPFMVPLNYADTTKWNKFETKYINGVFVSAIVIDRMNWLSQDAGSEDQWGDLNFYDGGEIRGFRLGFVGTLNFEKPWIYTIFAATNAFDKGFEVKDTDNLSFFDYRLDIPFFRHSVMSIGKQKEPISMDRLTSGTFLSNQERAAVSDAMLPSRNIGIVWNGSSPERYSSWAFGVFNNWLEEKNSFDEGATQYIGRLSWAPLVSEDESNLLHMDFGYRYSDAKQGFQYLTEPEFNKAPDFVDTGFYSAEKTETYNAGLAWRRGPTTLSYEYTRTDVANPDLANPTFDGYYLTAAWVLTGEMRAYSKTSGTFTGIPVAKTVYQNGKGAWELYARYSDIDLNDGAVEGGKMQVATLGLNWWLTPFFTVNVGYKYIWNEKLGEKGESSGMMTRFILVLE